MIKDIVPELLEKIQQEFQNNTAKSKILKAKIQALKAGKATHLDSNEFAIEVGKILADIFKNEISADNLPDNRMYYNIAKRLIDPNLKINYDLVSDYSTNVQDLLNKKSNISLKTIKPKLNQDRIDGIVNKISEYDDFEKGKWLLDEPIKNFTQSIVDDTIKTNADFQYNAGLSPKIERKEVGNCCDWCKAVVGVYEYPDVPKDIYRRHQRCRCTVDYVPGNGKKQDVWSKKWTTYNESDKIQERIKFSGQKERLRIPRHSSSIKIIEKIRSGEISTKCNREHFEKHTEGTKQYRSYLESREKRGWGPQSSLTITFEESQELIDQFAGTGIVASTKKGVPKKREDVNFKKYIGYYYRDGKKFPTTKGAIHYSKKGAHIVPIEGDYFD